MSQSIKYKFHKIMISISDRLWKATNALKSNERIDNYRKIRNAAKAGKIKESRQWDGLKIAQK